MIKQTTKRKMYSFPKLGGGSVTKNLAPVTNQRFADFLKFFEVKKVSDLRTQEGGVAFSLQMLDTAGNEKKLAQLMDICLQEGSAEIDFGPDFNLELSDEAAQDFFAQRSKRFVERAIL